MTYHIRSQADWQACLEVLERGDRVDIHVDVRLSYDTYCSLEGIELRFMNDSCMLVKRYFNEAPPVKHVYLVSPVFCQETPS